MCNPYLRLRCAAGLCELEGDGTSGSPCSIRTPLACNEGLYCDTFRTPVGACAPKLPDGAPCDLDFVAAEGCASGYCEWSDASSVCAPFPICDQDAR